MKPILAKAAAAVAIAAGVLTASAADFGASGWRSSQPNKWRHEIKANKSTVTNGSATTQVGDSYGVLYMPDGNEWYYTSTFTYDDMFSIAKADFVIYDNTSKKVGELSCPFTLAEGETSINYVELNPNVTRKFFNYDDNLEFMIFIHATTVDYTGSFYNLVVQMGGSEPIMRIDGNQVQIIDKATNSYSEDITMVFEREDANEEGYTLYYDIYNRATYSTPNRQAELVHTFEVPYKYIEGNEYFAAILATVHKGAAWFALPRYEKPYFVETENEYEENPEVTPDNNFIIDLYDGKFNLVKSTVIPMSIREGFLFTMPMIGDLSFTNDVVWGRYSDSTTLPDYVVTFANYLHSTDSFICDYEVYNADGEALLTLGNDVFDRMHLTDFDGQPEQVCFLHEDSELGYSFQIVNLNDGTTAATIPAEFGDNTLTTSMDRAMLNGRPYYVFSFGLGEYVDGDIDRLNHLFAWFNSDGSFSHIDTVPMGGGIYMVDPYVSGRALNPYFFSTKGMMAYMMLVKHSPDGGRVLEELLRVVDLNGNNLLEMGPEGENYIVTAFVLNADTNPALLVTYGNSDWQYYTKYVELPLECFTAGGDGTAENPYLISTVGDLQQIGKFPSANYRVANNIDATGYAVNAVMDEFTGSIDGAGHSVVSLTINGSIIDYLSEGASITDLTLFNPVLNLDGVEDNAAFIAANTAAGENAPVIHNVKVIGGKAESETFESYVAGIVGRAALRAQIEGCYVADTEIKAPRAAVGGIAGVMYTGATIKSSYFGGLLNGNEVGGIVSNLSSTDASIADCHVDATIIGQSGIGGIAGTANRSHITNCYVEGSIIAQDDNDPAAGGIVGHLESSFETEASPIITDNIVNLSEMVGEGSTIHRIVGHCVNDDPGEVDWEDPYWNGNPDYNNPSEWPRLPNEPEKGLTNNYAISPAVNGSIPATADSVEGETIEAITSELLGKLGFAMGETIATPWVFGSDLHLFFEDDNNAAISVDLPEINLNEGEFTTIAFTVAGVKIEDVTVTTSNDDVAVIDEKQIVGSTIYVTVECVGGGIAEIIAESGEVSAKCVVSGTSGVEAVVAEELALTYDGTTIAANGAEIAVYDIAGKIVTTGSEHVFTTSLSAGIYIVKATNGTTNATIKIIVK